MKRISLITLFLCTLVIAVMGCSDNNEAIVGKWEWPTKTLPDGSKTTIIYEFYKDGRLTITSHTVSEKQGIDVERITKCNYTYTKNTIKYSFSAEDVEFTKYKIEGLSQKEIESRIEFEKEYFSDSEMILSDVKIESDELKVNMGKMSITFKRIN